LAAAIAADGLPVATLSYCNMRPWRGRHVQNGRDMIALAQTLEARRVVYAGFSAGALAALIAGRNDPRAVGIVALDLVDAEGLGHRAARGLDKPLVGLAGEPTNCNADGNGRRTYAASDRAVVRRIEGAGHCDFESPSDRLCELVCEDPDAPAPSRRHEIIAAATAAVREMLEAGSPRRSWCCASAIPASPTTAARHGSAATEAAPRPPALGSLPSELRRSGDSSLEPYPRQA
jgi:hypothetical protein